MRGDEREGERTRVREREKPTDSKKETDSNILGRLRSNARGCVGFGGGRGFLCGGAASSLNLTGSGRVTAR